MKIKPDLISDKKDPILRYNICIKRKISLRLDPGSGKRVQDVWAKRWTRAEESDRIKKRKRVDLQNQPI